MTTLRPAVHVRAADGSPRMRSVVLQMPDGAETTLTVEANVPLADGAGAWLPAALLPAMKCRRPLVVHDGADAVQLDHCRNAQRLLSGWYQDLAEVPVDAVSLPAAARPPLGVGCFFSGGVDSFYSALKNADRITHLIFVLGFDIQLSNDALSRNALSATREAAKALGKSLIEVRVSGLSDFGKNLSLHWGTQYHGAALATIGLLLAPVLSKVIIPGSYQEKDLHPWGTHPDLDHLWSSSQVEFIHDAVDVSRPQKVAAIVEEPTAMEHLRVCWESTDEYNCGRCEKCIRTAVNLHVVGASGRCRSLPRLATPTDVRGLKLDSGSATFARENLDALRSSGQSDSAMEAALVQAIRRGVRHERLLMAKRLVRRLIRISNQ